MRSLYILFVFIYCISLRGQDIQCFVLEPPEQILNGVNKIAVMDFSGSYGRELSDYLISALLEEQRGISTIKGGLFSSDKEGKTYLEGARTDIYTIVERSRLDEVLKEQNLGTRGIVDESQAANLGKVLGVDAIIIGTVNPNSDDSNTKEERRYKKNGQWYSYYEDCTTRKVNVDSRMRIISVNTGQIMGTKEASYKAEDKQCGDNRSQLFSTDELIKQCLRTSVNEKFANYFSPRFILKEYEVLEIDLDQYEDMSDKAIEYFEAGNFDKAFVIYSSILKEDPYNDAAQYNLGVLNEVVGNYQAALDNYQAAFNIRDDDDYGDAINNVNRCVGLNDVLSNLNIKIQPHNFSVTEEQLKSATAEKVRLNGDRGDRINLYREPNKTSEIIVKVPGGIELELLEKQGDWFKVKTFDEKIGFVNEDDID